MATKKLSKSHTAARKKRSAPASTRTKKTSLRTKKALSIKAREPWAQDKPPKPKKLTPEQLKKRNELTQRIFDAAYEANQRGEFHRL